MELRTREGKALPAAVPIDVVYCSPFERCVQTAQHLCAEAGVEEFFIDYGLSECLRPEMHGYEPPEHHVGKSAWHRAYPLARLEGTEASQAYARYPESHSTYDQRFVDSFHRLSTKHPGKAVLLVTHGYMVIRSSWIGGMDVRSCDYCAVNQLVPDGVDARGKPKWICRIVADTTFNSLVD